MSLKRSDTGEKEFEKKFEEVYLSYYAGMVRFAKEYVLSREDAENIVHDAFTEVWHMRKENNYQVKHLISFLFTSIKNKCIDCLRHQIIVRETETILQEEHRRDLQMKFNSLEAIHEDLITDTTIDEIIYKALQSLPEKCREIFIKSKLEGKKRKEIAMELNISIHTIETQMGIAYRKLKTELKDYLPVFFFILHL